MTIIGWGAIDKTGEQSQYPRQVILPFNKTSNANSSARYFLETNVGPDGEDTCKGDSGWTLNLYFLWNCYFSTNQSQIT